DAAFRMDAQAKSFTTACGGSGNRSGSAMIAASVRRNPLAIVMSASDAAYGVGGGHAGRRTEVLIGVDVNGGRSRQDFTTGRRIDAEFEGQIMTARKPQNRSGHPLESRHGDEPNTRQKNKIAFGAGPTPVSPAFLLRQ